MTTPSPAPRRVLSSKLALLVLATVGPAGCLVLPESVPPVQGIPPVQRESFRLGETRRVDFLMRYGEPELRIDADRVMVYRWSRLRATVVLLSPVGAAGIPVRDAEALFLEFGADGRLVRMATAAAWKDEDIANQAESWARGESLLPQPK